MRSDLRRQRQAEGLLFKIGSRKSLKDGGLEGQESYRSYRIILWSCQFDYKVRFPPLPQPTPVPSLLSSATEGSLGCSLAQSLLVTPWTAAHQAFLLGYFILNSKLQFGDDIQV